MSETKSILDACCGSRMFWFDKQDPRAIYMDNRELDTVCCDGRTLNVHPDIIADFRAIPFPDNRFNLVVFDPPHLVRAGEDSYMRQKYGRLDTTWKVDIKRGFDECMRVATPGGVLIVKWSDCQVKVSELIAVLGAKPLFGNRTRKTGHWLVYIKPDPEGEQGR